ncbi:MAG: PLDc N-terminal domain-containing protein [Opitutales bacterium]|nr:PLDc N-terminal domain-containing protein [Opitutales bacterium]
MTPENIPEAPPIILTEGTHWVLLLAQSVAFILAVAIILRLAHEKRTPSNIFAWSLLLLFMPLVGVPLYMLIGGRKIRRLVNEKARMLELARQNATPDFSKDKACVLCSGNSVTLLNDGVEAYRTLCKEMERARESILITTFILGNDSVGRSIVRRLIRKARSGVKVMLLIDALGSWNSPMLELKVLRRAGGKVVRFIPIFPFVASASANLRNHRKLAIFDGRRAIVGGQNMDSRFLSPKYSKELFADLGLCVEGPIVSALTPVFIGDWAFASKSSLETLLPLMSKQAAPTGESVLELIPSGPDVDGDPLWERIITLVQEARESITIVTPYFLPDEVLLRSLIIKAHMGRKVTVIVPENSNHPIVDMARNRYLRHMSAQGVKILFYTKRMLHAKLIMVDGRFAVSGSANIDPRSFFVNFEIGIIHSSSKDIQAFRNWLETRILPRCNSYADSPKSRESKARLLAENMANLLTPMM